ncbi:MFS transporter [Paenibacillus sp. OK003]|uniref:MFS transporter n=1 Tax=Paenibacillus sp. OK003 TaxID=1884380 RepID=UPI0008D01400|nr:glycoside-pentoside-hexuronide (GPH):cation symporter [Paenibacillus sp. OK003]SEK61122.1 glycoside/pentoside/hexuronide:cation symporter, GPH family [Paenibacillus sp. OK003]
MGVAVNDQHITSHTDTPHQPQREIPTKRLIGDSMGMFGLNISSGLLGLITYYYTDVVGVSAAIVGTVLLVTKLLDAVADVGMGVLVDRTKSKYGQARPWLLWMSIPMFVSLLLLFSVPDISVTGKIVYAIITNLVFYIMVYTPTFIPYSSLMALTTRNTYERSLMGIIRSSSGYLAGMVVAIAFLPIVNAMGGGRREWTILAGVFAFMAAAGILIAFFSNREKYNNVQLDELGVFQEKISLVQGLNMLISNKYWLLMFTVGTFSHILFALGVAAGTYYAKYIWGDVNLVAIMGGIGLIPVVIGFSLSGPFIKKFGKRNTALGGVIIGLIGATARLIAPESIMLGLVCSIFQTLGTIPLMAVGGALTTDTIEYGEWKFRKRIVGLTNSVNAFGNKVGTALGAAMIGWLLALGGYVEQASEQGNAAKQAIIALNIYVPIVVMAVIAICLFFYKLDKEFPKILKDLEERRTAKI